MNTGIREIYKKIQYTTQPIYANKNFVNTIFARDIHITNSPSIHKHADTIDDDHNLQKRYQ